MKHLSQIKHALGISGVVTSTSSWRYRASQELQDEGNQVDMLIDRADACINLCEMKFSESEVTIDKNYARPLQARRDTFRRVTKTRKTVFITFVTTNGIRDNPYALEVVDSSLTMGVLFAQGLRAE